MDDKPIPRCLHISNSDWEWLKREAEKQDRSVAYYVRMLIKKEREANENERV